MVRLVNSTRGGSGRTVSMVTPPADMPLGTAIDLIKEQVDPAIREQLPEDGDISYQGTADDKDTAIRNMAQSLALAIAILYLLMSALFRSFIDSLLVLLCLPLATVGGVAALVVAWIAQDLVFWLVLFAWGGLGAAFGPALIAGAMSVCVVYSFKMVDIEND